MARSVATAALAGAALATFAAASAPVASAAPTSAPYVQPSASYHVSGLTATYKLKASGSQAYWMGADNKPTSIALTHGLTIAYGDGQYDGVDGGTPITCASGPQRTPTNFVSGPFTHTYAKPGVYTVRLTVQYCGVGQEKSTTTQMKVWVGTGASGVKPVKPVAQPTTALPASRTAPGAAARPAMGPKVSTDEVGRGTEGLGGLGAAGAALGGAAALAGIATVARRRS